MPPPFSAHGSTESGHTDPRGTDPSRTDRKRGEPLVVLVLILLAWVAGRSLFWEAPRFAEPAGYRAVGQEPRAVRPGAGSGAGTVVRVPMLGAPAVLMAPPLISAPPNASPLMRSGPLAGTPGAEAPLWSGADHGRGGSEAGGENGGQSGGQSGRQSEGQAGPPLAMSDGGLLVGDGARAMPASPPPAASLAAAHQMLWMAAMANLPLPAGMAAARPRRLSAARRVPAGATGDSADPPAEQPAELVVNGRWKRAQPSHFAPPGAPAGVMIAGLGAVGGRARWSGDGWLLMRRGGDRAGAAGVPNGPTYGANQIGAVLRYRLVPGEKHRLNAYVRGYGALNGTGEQEAAAGLSGRVLPAVPVSALAEMRVSRFVGGKTHARPAASLVTEIAPIKLGKGVLGERLEAETYVQAGYVGGAAATPFVDGQLRVEEIVSRLGRAELRVGVGAWGGAQDGVSRLDVGPSARLSWSGGKAGARVSLDWRVRIEGNAAPNSGPALTVSAGF